MAADSHPLFDSPAWRSALEKFGAVTHLTVQLYGLQGDVVCGPVNATPLFTVFETHGYDPGAFAECARACLDTERERQVVIVAPESGLAVVGTSLMLGDRIVGAAVAGYAMVDFCQRASIERMARQADLPFRELWDVARQQPPIPARRLSMHGELLQVLCDTVVREGARTREYEEAAAQLRIASAEKDEFLAVLSHELRTPLTPILGWARMLKMGLDQAKTARAADAIQRNAELQLRLVDDLLELNRAARGTVVLELRLHSLQDLVHGAVDGVGDVAREKGISLHCIEAPTPQWVRGDENRLQQVLRNVLSNAVKFTPRGGHVTITLSSDGADAVIVVRDTGQGISPEFIPSAFNMFRQQDTGTKRRHAGMGIGLALVKRLTEAHHGTVTIASDGVGHGTAVTLRLPLTAVSAETRAPEPTLAPSRSLESLRVLVVEDNADSRDAICEMLGKVGAQVFAAADGLDALDHIIANPVDLVLCDLRMPNMDGFEFLMALRQWAGQSTPVIAISGQASSADHARTHHAGFEAHIDKPFDERRVVEEVGAVMRQRTPHRIH